MSTSTPEEELAAFLAQAQAQAEAPTTTAGPGASSGEGAATATGGTEGVACPEPGCTKTVSYRHNMPGHLRAKHGWDADAIASWKQSQPKRVTARVESDVPGPDPSPPGSFGARMEKVPRVQRAILGGGNQVLLQGLLMLNWFPPTVLINFKSDPQTGIPIPQLDNPTDLGRFCLLDEREAWVYAMAWCVSEDTPLMRFLERNGLLFAQGAAAIGVAAVTFAHIRRVWELKSSPQVQQAKAELEAFMQAMAQAQAAQANGAAA